MCVIIWSPSGDVPTAQVTRAMSAHPDGWGFAVSTGKGVTTHRSVSRDRFLRAWFVRKPGPVLFHARWATHGAVCTDNCHPFVVRRHSMVMAHNGVIPYHGSETKSDTRDFIERVIEPLPRWFINEDGVLDAIAERIGNSKLVFLRSHGRATIINEHLGVWRGGLWYSNKSVLT